MKRVVLVGMLVVGLAVVSVAGAAAEDWKMYPEGALGYTVLRGNEVYLQVDNVAWGPSWAWFSFSPKTVDETQAGRTIGAEATIGGTDKPISLKHGARQLAPDQVLLEYELAAPQSSDLTQIIVSVIPKDEFKGGKCIAVLASGERSEVAIPFGRGNIGEDVAKLILQDAAGVQTVFSLEPARNVTMDGDGRIALVAGRIEGGKAVRTAVTVTLPAATTFYAEKEASVQRNDTSKWFPYPVGPEGVPIDLSFLSKGPDGKYIPAGAHGFVTVKDGEFVFEDGTPVRFWGLNITAGAVLGEPERAEQLAERLARLGVNVIRMHHLDSWANPIIDYNHPDGTTQHLNPDSVRALDKTIFELKKHGIYVVLDPWVQRCFKEADGVADYGNLGNRGNFNLHPFIYFDPRMQELIQKQWQQVWTHVNEFTGVAYKDEPACAMTEVINEGLLGGFGGMDRHPYYLNELKGIYEAWAKETDGLPWDQANVITQNYGKNNTDFMMYLHRGFYKKSHDFFRSIGVHIPINATNWAHWTWIMATQVGLDYMDHHHYYGGDQIGPAHGLGGLWLSHPPGMPGGPFGKMAGFAIPGEPLASSECGNNPPKTYRAAYQLGLAAVGAFQQWDSFTGYAYSQSGGPADTLGPFEWESDPVTVASVAAGALVFRRGDVSPARQTVVMNIPEEEIYILRYQDGGAKFYWNTAGFQAAIEQHKVLVTLPGDDPQDYDPVKVLDVEGAYSYQQPNTELRSDTGELWRDWKLGVGTIDTPRTQAAYGMLGESGKGWSTKDCAFDISTPFAVTALQSLTDEPVAQSGKLLLTAAARAENTGMAFNMARDKIVQNGRAPIIAEPVVGTVTFKTSRGSLTMYPIKVDGTRGAAVRVPVRNGTATIELKDAYQTIFYEIEAG